MKFGTNQFENRIKEKRKIKKGGKKELRKQQRKSTSERSLPVLPRVGEGGAHFVQWQATTTEGKIIQQLSPNKAKAFISLVD